MIKPIQYLRALAALMVVWHHALGQIPGTLNFIHTPDFGLSGVDLFFVISGFIMFVTTTEKPLTSRSFFELRIVRVVPLYWMMTLLVIGCADIAPSAFRTLRFSVTAVTKSLLFIPYNSLSFPGNAWPVLVPGWTLNYEMFFYALFTLALIIPIHWRLMSLVVTLIFLVIAGRMIGPSQSPFVWVYTSPLLLEFGAGAAIGSLWVRRRLHIPLAISVVAIVTGSYLLVMRDKPPLVNYSQMIGAPLVVAGCLHPAICLFRSKVLLALGDASYSIYLTQILSLGVLRAVWLHIFPQVSSVSAITNVVVALIACAAAGVMVCRWVEKPLTARLRLVIGPPPTFGLKCADGQIRLPGWRTERRPISPVIRLSSRLNRLPAILLIVRNQCHTDCLAVGGLRTRRSLGPPIGVTPYASVAPPRCYMRRRIPLSKVCRLMASREP